MFEPRIIPILLLKNRGLVKTLKFSEPKYIGDPLNAVRIFNEKEVDELLFLDIEASIDGRGPDLEYIKEVGAECFVPFAYGGGIRDLNDIGAVLNGGAEKVCLNSVLHRDPDLVSRAAEKFGSQAVVVGIDLFFDEAANKHVIRFQNGRRESAKLLPDYVKYLEKLGAGEVLIQSIDRDGTREGLDLDLVRRITDAVTIPVIAAGGVGKLSDFFEAFEQTGVSAVAAGSFFVFKGDRNSVLITYPERERIKEGLKRLVPSRRVENGMVNSQKDVVGNSAFISREYQICSRCILDTTNSDIAFDENGVCNLCRDYAESDARLKGSGQYTSDKLAEMVMEMVAAGKGRKYDCLMGVSGGMDSTFLGYLCHHLKLRPLCVHFDNGWNSELAVKNIERMISKYGYDLRTYVIDWEEFRDLQRSFFKASVVDIELLTDHAIFGSLGKIAQEEDIKFILGGGNRVSEYALPGNWNHYKMDALNIYAIQNIFGTKRIKNYPILDPGTWARLQEAGTRQAEFLNYIIYNIADVKKTIESEIGWEYYGWKHFESVFTRFYQGHFLVEKFKIDKRKAHLSNLIWSGQMTREEALRILGQPFYSEEQIRIDKEYVLKKLGFSEEEWQEIMRAPIKSHYDYPTQVARPISPYSTQLRGK